MVKLTSSTYFKAFLAALIVLSFGSIGVLAAMSPECQHCTLSIASKAMLGAKMLSSGWIFAGVLYCWDARTSLLSKLGAFRYWISIAKDTQV